MAVNPEKVKMPWLPRPLFFNVVLAIAVTVFAAGCAAPFLLVGAGAVGGYSVTRDAFEGVTSSGQDEIWEAANRVLSIMGVVDSDSRKQGQLDATIYGAHVIVTVTPINLTTTKLRVKARKFLLPRAGLAQDVYTKIINQLQH